MKIEYIVSYPEWNAKLQWHRKTRKFTDILERNKFMKAREEDLQGTGYTPAGTRVYVKQIILHDEQGDF